MERIRELTRRLLSAREPLTLAPGGRVPAAVLLLLYEQDDSEYLLLQRRAGHTTTHAGEIGLPGGRRESRDRTPLDTALRETHEEIGVRPTDVEVLGRLDDAATRSSNYAIAPYVGAIARRGPYDFRLDPAEVAALLPVPLAALRDPARVAWSVRDLDGEAVAERTFRYGEELIWGVTAQIVGQYVDLLAEAGA